MSSELWSLLWVSSARRPHSGSIVYSKVVRAAGAAQENVVLLVQLLHMQIDHDDRPCPWRPQPSRAHLFLCVRGPYYEYNGRGYAVLPGVDIRCHMPVSVFTVNKELRVSSPQRGRHPLSCLLAFSPSIKSEVIYVTRHKSDDGLIGEDRTHGLYVRNLCRHKFGHRGQAYRTTRPIRRREPAKAPLQRKSKRGSLSIT